MMIMDSVREPTAIAIASNSATNNEVDIGGSIMIDLCLLHDS